MKEIPATRGFVAIVDDEDFEYLSQFSWRAVESNPGSFRPVRSLWKFEEIGKGRSRLLYRDLLRPPADMVVDHINGDPWDNRRCNLRICTQAQNAANQRSARGSRIAFKGVKAERGRFRAHLRAAGVDYPLGSYPTAEEAAKAYDAAALWLHGEFACLSLPNVGTQPRAPDQILADSRRDEIEARERLVAKVLFQLRRGLTVRAAGKAVGVSRNVVWRIAKDHGLHLTRHRRPNTIIDRSAPESLAA